MSKYIKLIEFKFIMEEDQSNSQDENDEQVIIVEGIINISIKKFTDRS